MTQISIVALQMNGLHFDTKNIFYAYSIVEIIITEKLQMNYHFVSIKVVIKVIADLVCVIIVFWSTTCESAAF